MALGVVWTTVYLGLFIAILAAAIMGFFSSKNHFDVDGKTIVITGGSQGMGRGLAKLLAQKGANIVIVARTQSKLDEALKYISEAAKNPRAQRFHSISADVTKPEENDRIIQEVTTWNNGIPPDIVWANAGSAHPALFLNTPPEILKSQMDINYFASAYLAQSALRSWLEPSPQTVAEASGAKSKQQPRHFIMTSSVVCFVGVAGYAPYAPPKSAMRSLADTLRQEINLYNGVRRKDPANGPPADIQIHCVCPGTITSPGHEEEQKSKHEITKILEKDDPAQNEDEVAKAAVKGLEKGGYLITTQILGSAMRVSSLGGAPRNNALVDTLFSWAVAVAFLFVGPDMEGKVFGFGKKYGLAAVK